MKVTPEDFVGVKEAARRSGYSRTYIHRLARDGEIESALVTENFRLVSWPDLRQHMEDKGRDVPEPEVVNE